MKKYKLIKEYPGSLKLGSVVTEYDPKSNFAEYRQFTDIYGKHYIPCFFVENLPEFWQEVKEPLFVTEDGVEIFDEESIIWLAKFDNIVFSGFLKNVFNDEHFAEYKIFSTEQEAIKWIEQNKPVFSKKQVLDALEKAHEYVCSDLCKDPINFKVFKKELGL